MPHAPATRPPITTTEMWLAAPMTSSRMPRASATAPTAGAVCVRVAGARRSRHGGSRRGRDRGVGRVPAGHGRGRRGPVICPGIRGRADPGPGRPAAGSTRSCRWAASSLAQLRHRSGARHAERRGQRGRGGQRGPRRRPRAAPRRVRARSRRGREATGPVTGPAAARAGTATPGRRAVGRGPRAGRGPLLPPALVGRYRRQGRGRGRLLQGRLQAPVGHPERVAAFLQLPGELVDLRVPQRGQLLPGLGLERGEEVGLGEQQVLGVVQGQPEPRIPGPARPATGR